MSPPRTIACVGAGSIGSSWALLFALKGNDVVVYDLTASLLQKSLRNIEVMLRVLRENSAISESNREETLKRITLTARLSDVAEADYVQESVIENIEAKIQVFKELENLVQSDTLLASSTSGFPMSEIQRGLQHPERTIVAHPFNPPHLIPLVELVPGNKTSQRTLESVHELMTALGKVPILVKKEIRGFAANRIQVAMIREILSLVDNDVASMEDIEKIFYAGIGLRYAVMGPFAIETVNGGPGGLEQDFEHFKPALEGWLESMVTWTEIPSSAEQKAISQSRELVYLKERNYDELVKWRDEELIKLLRLRGYLTS